MTTARSAGRKSIPGRDGTTALIYLPQLQRSASSAVPADRITRLGETPIARTARVVGTVRAQPPSPATRVLPAPPCSGGAWLYGVERCGRQEVPATNRRTVLTVRG